MEMKTGEAINKLIKDNKLSHASLAKRIGREHSTSVSNAVARQGQISVNFLLEITESLGYEVILKPTSGEGKAERTVKLIR